MDLIELNKDSYKEFCCKMDAHFLQSYEWGQIAKFNGNNVYYLGLMDRGYLKATALLLKKELPFNYSYFYIPRGFTIDYYNYDLVQTMSNLIRNFCLKHRALFFKIDPDIRLHTIDDHAHIIGDYNNYKLVETLTNIGFKHQKLTKFFETMQPRYTFRIDLEADIDSIESRYSRTTKSRLKKTLSNEVYIEMGNQNDIQDFIRLMKMTEKRQNFYSHSDKYYRYFYKVFSNSNMVDLYLARVDIPKLRTKLFTRLQELNKNLNILCQVTNKKNDGQKRELQKNIIAVNEQLAMLKDCKEKEVIISASLVVHYNKKSWCLYMANDNHYKSLFANYAIYQRQIKDAFLRQDLFFDVFGTIGDPDSKSNLIGIHNFKRKWGGEYTEFIGEFDYVLHPILYYAYKMIIPIRRKIVNYNLRKKELK